MSYSRFGWDGSDVYVFFAVDGFLECGGCLLQNREWIPNENSPSGGMIAETGDNVPKRFSSTQEMLDHLKLHEAAGHSVPPELPGELLADDERNFPSKKES